uniref:Uncharacterized protein n=1 Tax=Caenorhabditis japonica TaxID=281687 RepID=A0A8R1EDW6_CAEJA
MKCVYKRFRKRHIKSKDPKSHRVTNEISGSYCTTGEIDRLFKESSDDEEKHCEDEFQSSYVTLSDNILELLEKRVNFKCEDSEDDDEPCSSRQAEERERERERRRRRTATFSNVDETEIERKDPSSICQNYQAVASLSSVKFSKQGKIINSTDDGMSPKARRRFQCYGYLFEQRVLRGRKRLNELREKSDRRIEFSTLAQVLEKVRKF